jgi:hypothetical protein
MRVPIPPPAVLGARVTDRRESWRQERLAEQKAKYDPDGRQERALESMARSAARVRDKLWAEALAVDDIVTRRGFLCTSCGGRYETWEHGCLPVVSPCIWDDSCDRPHRPPVRPRSLEAAGEDRPVLCFILGFAWGAFCVAAVWLWITS